MLELCLFDRSIRRLQRGGSRCADRTRSRVSPEPEARYTLSEPFVAMTRAGDTLVLLCDHLPGAGLVHVVDHFERQELLHTRQPDVSGTL